MKVGRLEEHVDLVPSHTETWLQHRQIVLELVQSRMLESSLDVGA